MHEDISGKYKEDVKRVCFLGEVPETDDHRARGVCNPCGGFHSNYRDVIGSGTSGFDLELDARFVCEDASTQLIGCECGNPFVSWSTWNECQCLHQGVGRRMLVGEASREGGVERTMAYAGVFPVSCRGKGSGKVLSEVVGRGR